MLRKYLPKVIFKRYFFSIPNFPGLTGFYFPPSSPLINLLSILERVSALLVYFLRVEGLQLLPTSVLFICSLSNSELQLDIYL